MSDKGKSVHSIRQSVSCRPRKNNPNHASKSILRSCLFAFLAGVGLSAALLAMLAFLLAHTALSLSLVRPLACGAAACGAVLSGALLAKKIGRQMLLCGGLCGGFYALCQLLAAFLANGTAAFTSHNLMLPVALFLGGTLGGAWTALRVVR